MMYKMRITLWSVERLVLGEWNNHPEIHFANLGENSLGLEKSQNYLDRFQKIYAKTSLLCY